MKTPTQIITDAQAFVRSTMATLVALSLTIGGTLTAIAAFTPGEENKAKLAAAGVVITGFGTAVRQGIAWLDTKNTSFGRVKVDPDILTDVSSPEAIEAYLQQEQQLKMVDDLPDEYLTAEGQETQSEPEGI